MNLPPIISNLPIFKTLKSGGADKATSAPEAAAQAGVTAPQDSVDLSGKAQARLDGIQSLSSAQAAATAQNTGKLLADSNLALGLDPSYGRE